MYDTSGKIRATITAALLAMFVAVTLLVFGWGLVSASDIVEQRREAAKLAFERFKESHGSKWELKFDNETGLPKALYGSEYQELPGDPEEVARSFLNGNRELFLLKKDLTDLRAVKVLKGAKTKHVKFQQYYKGLKVFLSGVDVHMRDKGKIRYVKNSYKPLGDIDVEPSVSLGDALATAMNDIGVEGALRGETKAELVIYPAGKQYLLSWQLLIPSSKPLGTWLVIVDATKGEVLFKKNILRHFRGK